MISTALQYHRPASADEASSILAEHDGDVAVLGGGTWLVPLMGRGELSVGHVVDLRGLGLGGVDVAADRVELGAMASYEDVLGTPGVADAVPLLDRMASGITGGRSIRHQGTVVGSACYANPSSDVPAVLVALGATLHVHGPSGGRDVPAADFFRDAFVTALQAGEFARAVSVPRGPAAFGYVKVKLSAGSWPIATAAAVRDAAGGTSVTVGAVQRRPLRVELGEQVRTEDVAELVVAGVDDPWSDVLASGEYRREVAGVVARRAVEQLQEA